MEGTPLARPEDLAVWFPGVPATDPRLKEALTEASNRFRAAVRHHVSLEQGRTVTLDGNGRRVLRLPSVEVAPRSVIATIDGEPVGIVASTAGIIARVDGRPFPKGLANVEVTYDGGFPEDAIPVDIQAVVLDQAKAIYTVRRGVSSMQVGGISVAQNIQESIGVTQGWSDAVAAYRIRAGDRA